MPTEAALPEHLGDEQGERAADTRIALYCIVGLGNPGIKYRDTPHNIGFAVADELAKRHGIRINRNAALACTGVGKVRQKDVILVKPQTFMNQSGSGVQEILKSRTLTNRNLIVVHDELDLPWKALRIKEQGSAAGHNGVKSIIAAVKTNVFTRVRVGIHPDHPIEDAAEFVLAPWERAMQKDVSEMVFYTADAIETIVAEGANKAMTKFNRRAQGMTEEDE